MQRSQLQLPQIMDSDGLAVTLMNEYVNSLVHLEFNICLRLNAIQIFNLNTKGVLQLLLSTPDVTLLCFFFRFRLQKDYTFIS